MITETRHIDLHLPTGWNQATTEELEHIAAAIILCQQRQDRYHSFDWAQVKLMAVLAINGLEIVSQPVPVIPQWHKGDGSGVLSQANAHAEPSPDDTWLMRRSKDEEPFPITVGQLADLCTRLDWLTEENPRFPLFAFPYPEMSVPSGSAAGKEITLVGPPPLLDGYTWQEYRWLTDWMQAYMQQTNAHRDATAARNEFLAVLFKPKAPVPDGSPSGVTAALFASFPPVKWQVILFWWSALMLQLERKFPKVFKQQPVGKQRRQQKDTPWDFYNRVIATIQKYVGGLSEKDVNTASYGTILQQLDMMAREAEEMERLNKKYKK